MKQNDKALVAVSVIVGAILSLVLTNMLFGSSKRQTKVEVVEKITADFVQPDERYFNNDSINPTQPIQIGGGTNQVQFGQ